MCYLFLFLLVGLRTHRIISNNLNITNINYLLFIFIGIYLIFLLLGEKGKLKSLITSIMPLITGITIYLPLLFIKNIALATSIGVGMHWCQYISIMWFINARKMKIKSSIPKKKVIINIFDPRISFTLVYALLMSFFTFYGISNDESLGKSYNLFYLIPILFHLFHFYIDGHIWKFSDKHIKKMYCLLYLINSLIHIKIRNSS